MFDDVRGRIWDQVRFQARTWLSYHFDDRVYNQTWSEVLYPVQIQVLTQVQHQIRAQLNEDLD